MLNYQRVDACFDDALLFVFQTYSAWMSEVHQKDSQQIGHKTFCNLWLWWRKSQHLDLWTIKSGGCRIVDSTDQETTCHDQKIESLQGLQVYIDVFLYVNRLHYFTLPFFLLSNQLLVEKTTKLRCEKKSIQLWHFPEHMIIPVDLNFSSTDENIFV